MQDLVTMIMTGSVKNEMQCAKLFPVLYCYRFRGIEKLLRQANEIHFEEGEMKVRINAGGCGLGKTQEALVIYQLK